MIITDQPTCFNPDIIAAVSSKEDGQMQLGWNEKPESVIENRRNFLKQSSLTPENSTLVRVKYSPEATYDIIREVGEPQKGSGMLVVEGEPSDCLVTTTAGLGLFVPIADCIATIVHDPVNKVLALAHLGRHSTVANLAKKLVDYLQQNHQSKPEDLIIWMSPSIHVPHYVLQTADFAVNNPDWQPFCTKVEAGYSLDMQGYNQAQFLAAGVQKNNITISPICTAIDENYWSHYTQTSVHGHVAPPRFAVVCALK